MHSYTEEGRAAPCWLRTSSRPHALDALVPTGLLLEKQAKTLTEAQAEEVERMRLGVMVQKSAISHALNDLQAEVHRLEQRLAAVSGDRMKTMVLQREVNRKRNELAKKQERRFFEQMELDVALENRINEFLERGKLTAEVVRQFVIEVGGKNYA